MPPILKRFILQKNLEAMGKERGKVIAAIFGSRTENIPISF
jgi:hypothetical protein